MLNHVDIVFVCVVLLYFTGISTAVLDEECGMRPAHGRVTRVANGRDALRSAWPWIGRIERQTGELVCTMALIDSQWAVTSADCLSHSPKIHAHVYEGLVGVFGVADIEMPSPSAQRVPLGKMFVHPEFDGVFGPGNIALVRLANPVNITDYVRPVCLSKTPYEIIYKTCWLAGWGYLNVHSEDPTRLQEAFAELKTYEECQELGGVFLPDYATCASGAHPCGGDGGAPLVCLDPDDDLWHAVGLFSYFYGECGDQFSVYTRIYSYLDFINETVQNFEECNSPYLLCNDGVTCVPDDEICNGIEDCPSGDDELDCPKIFCNATKCARKAECIDREDGFYCDCAAGWTGRFCDQVDCGDGSISLSPGQTATISSPGYPMRNYQNSAACLWFIDVMPGNKALVQFEDMELERGYDFLEIDGTTYTGTNYPSNLTSSSEKLVIKFTSNPYDAFTGFLLNVSAIDVTGLNECGWNPCENGGYCNDTEDGYTCQCMDGWVEPNCHTADYCGPEEIILGMDSSYNLTTFNYPGKNEDRLFYSCKWIAKAPSDHRIKVDFIDNGLYEGFDSLFFDGESVVEMSSEYISAGDSMEIVFYNSGFSMGFSFALSDFLPPDGEECFSSPCQNAGRCIEEKNGYTCKCRRGFRGKHCEKAGAGSSTCPENDFRCAASGRCIDSTKVCDTRPDCGQHDISDEINCKCEFQCEVGRCIPQRYVCDCKKHCEDGSDEMRPGCPPC